jgi:hypothetical protein
MTFPSMRRRVERRLPNRPEDQPCFVCNAPPSQATVTQRTAYFVFFKCDRCRHVWTLDIPSRSVWKARP